MTGLLALRARAALHRAGWSLAGILLILPGLAFLTVALWLLLSEMRDTLFAASIIGAIYLGLGLICMALARRRPRIPVPPSHAVPPRPAAFGPELVAALMQGVTAGMAARAAARRPPPPPSDP